MEDIKQVLNPKPIPNPLQEEINSELFESIFQTIKNWDIGIRDYYSGYCSGNGSHVKIILDAIKPIIRENKINQLLND